MTRSEPERPTGVGGDRLCEELEPCLSSFIDGELSGEQDRLLLHHLPNCPRCAARVEGYLKVAVMARQLLRTAGRASDAQRPVRFHGVLERLTANRWDDLTRLVRQLLAHRLLRRLGGVGPEPRTSPVERRIAEDLRTTLLDLGGICDEAEEPTTTQQRLAVVGRWLDSDVNGWDCYDEVRRSGLIEPPPPPLPEPGDDATRDAALKWIEESFASSPDA